MKTTKLNAAVFLAGIILFLSFSACDVFNSPGDKQPDRPFERRELPRSLTAQELQLVEGSGSFGFDLLQKLVEQNPDASHFISPLSIIMAYGMTMNGADGDTYSQMQEVFGLKGLESDEINMAAPGFNSYSHNF
jgi:hypothetical protein